MLGVDITVLIAEKLYKRTFLINKKTFLINKKTFLINKYTFLNL